MVTIKKIAELCGVSRGTVDRVLNGRGRVKPETAEAVMNMVKQLGYKPNPAGKALAARRHRPIVGVILNSEGNAFFDEIIRGIETAESRYQIYGMKLTMRRMKGYDVEAQLALIDELESIHVSGLIISPINDTRIAEAINALVDKGVFVVNVNNDVQNCRRQFYVGSDYTNGGETACALLQLLRGQTAKIGVVTGSRQAWGHELRLEGFQRRMEKVPGFSILATAVNKDDEIRSYEETKKMLEEHPDIDSLFIVAGGVYGACRAVVSLKKEKDLTIVAFDSTPTTVDMMKQGVLKTIIYQHPYQQGYRAMDLAFQYLVNDQKPERERYILKNEIKLLENL